MQPKLLAKRLCFQLSSITCARIIHEQFCAFKKCSNLKSPNPPFVGSSYIRDLGSLTLPLTKFSVASSMGLREFELYGRNPPR